MPTETTSDAARLSVRQESPDGAPEAFATALADDIARAGGEWHEAEEYRGAIGRTMFDSTSSKDHTITVLLPPGEINHAPSQSLLRIKSRPPDMGGDGRQYLAAIIQGPFSEPDGLRADAPLVVTTTVRGTTFLPRYHGRIQVQILGEEIEGQLHPPRFRPLPNSPVFPLSQEETEEKLHLAGDVRLGLAVGYDNMPVAFPSTRKDVLPRHLGILGTTGGGKSTTVSGLIGKLKSAGVAVVIFDTEGEYTSIMDPTEQPAMLAGLKKRDLTPAGVADVTLYHLVGRECRNMTYSRRKQFCLEFSNLSPYAVEEILNFNEAQQARFEKAFDLTKRLMAQFKIFPATEEEKTQLLDLDELEAGYPRMTLQHVYDIVRFCADHVDGDTSNTFLKTPEFNKNRSQLEKAAEAAKLPSNVFSWRKVQGSLNRLLKLGIFDHQSIRLPDYAAMTTPGQVSVIDLHDTDSPQINNLVISQILRGLQLQQEDNYAKSEKGAPLRRVEIMIEEAHEFLSAERIAQMPTVFQQVARIARRGRKRWLGLTFVTQLPQHLPTEVLSLINNYVLHKIADSNVITRLKKSIGGIDEGLWDRISNLAPGQAIVTTASMTRPLLVSIDPTPHKLRMTD